MAFLRPNIAPECYVMRGAKVGLRLLQVADYAAWEGLRAKSRAHLQPFEPVWPQDELLKNSYRRRLRHYQRELREDLGYALGIFAFPDEQLVGGLSLSNVRRGVTQAAQLGYWLGVDNVNKGLMADAVAATIPYAFFGLRLHRIEAATLPNNLTSIRVLERNGFIKEGYARRYLKINGAWQDHVLFGLTVEDYRVEGAAMAGRQSDMAAL